MARGVDLNLRAQQGYRAFSEGYTRPLDMSAIQQGYRDVEGKRRYEERRKDLQAENVNKMFESTRHDLIPAFGTNINARRDELLDGYTNGSISYEDLQRGIITLNGDIDNAKIVSEQAKAALPSLDTFYTAKDGRIIQGEEFATGFLDDITRDTSGEDFGGLISGMASELGKLNTVPTTDVEGYIIDNNNKIFEALASQSQLSPAEVENLRGSTQDRISWIESKVIENPDAVMASIASMPEIGQKLQYDYALAAQKGQTNLSYDDYARDRLSPVLKTREDKQEAQLRSNFREEQAARDANKDRKEQFSIGTPSSTYSPSEIEDVRATAVGNLKNARDGIFEWGGTLSEVELNYDNIEDFRSSFINALENDEKTFRFNGEKYDVDEWTDENGQNRAANLISEYDESVEEQINKIKQEGDSGQFVPIQSSESFVTDDGDRINIEGIIKDKNGDYYISGNYDYNVSVTQDGKKVSTKKNKSVTKKLTPKKANELMSIINRGSGVGVNSLEQLFPNNQKSNSAPRPAPRPNK